MLSGSCPFLLFTQYLPQDSPPSILMTRWYFFNICQASSSSISIAAIHFALCIWNKVTQDNPLHLMLSHQEDSRVDKAGAVGKSNRFEVLRVLPYNSLSFALQRTPIKEIGSWDEDIGSHNLLHIALLIRLQCAGGGSRQLSWSWCWPQPPLPQLAFGSACSSASQGSANTNWLLLSVGRPCCCMTPIGGRQAHLLSRLYRSYEFLQNFFCSKYVISEIHKLCDCLSFPIGIEFISY